MAALRNTGQVIELADSRPTKTGRSGFGGIFQEVGELGLGARDWGLVSSLFSFAELGSLVAG